MADLDFETQLSRLYTQAPAFRDAELFAQQVTERLDRGWAVRRLLIGAMGVVAGLAVAVQMLGSRFLSEFTAMSHDAQKLDLGLDRLVTRYDQMIGVNGTETLWVVGVMAALALAFAVTRLVDEV